MKQFKYISPYPLSPPRDGDVGIDVRTVGDVYVQDGETLTIHTGVRIEPPPGYWCEITPRSSISARGILVHRGIIDNAYRGEIGVVLTNLNGRPIQLKEGERIAQLVFHKLTTLDPMEVDSLNPTIRGENGFGSTGEF